MKSRLGLIFGLLLSVCIILFLVFSLNWGLFLEEMKKLNYVYLPLLIFLFVLSFWLRAVRWKYLLPANLNFPTMRLFSASTIGTLATCILPLRAGEFVRPWVLSRSEKSGGSSISMSLAFSSVITERVFDVLAMLTLFAFSFHRISDLPVWALYCVKVLAVVAGLIFFVMVLSCIMGKVLVRYIDRVLEATVAKFSPSFSDKLSEIAKEVLIGFAIVRNFKQFFLIVIWSYILWLEYSLFCYFVLVAFGVNESFWVANTVNVFIGLAVAAPSAPGFIGTFQLGCIAALTKVFGYPEEFAVAFSVVAHSIQMIGTFICGLVMLKYEGIGFKQLSTRT